MSKNSVTCKKCQMSGLVWKKSKNDKWYLAVEKEWQGDMTERIKLFYPAHNCENQIKNNQKQILELTTIVNDLEQLISFFRQNPESVVPGYLNQKEIELEIAKSKLNKLTA